MLQNLSSFKDGGNGVEVGGGVNIQVDYFDMIYDRLTKEIEVIMQSVSQLMQT
jgi:hypothetical protein